MKFRRHIGWLLIAILLAAVMFAPASDGTRWVATLHNSAHGPVFGCIAMLLFVLVRAHPKLASLAPLHQYILAIVVTALLGAATELIQGVTGRDASFFDSLHDVMGAVAFLALFYVFDQRLHEKPLAARGAALVVAVVLGALLAAPVVRSAVEYRRRDALFPVLADFSQYFDRYFVGYHEALLEHVRLPMSLAGRDEEHALRVIFLDAPYPGIDMFEPRADWSGYRVLALDLANPTDSELRLTLRIHDRLHNQQYTDQFNGSYDLPPRTRRQLRVPLARVEAAPLRRKLDLKDVASVMLFRRGESRAGEMYVVRAWLE